MIRKRLLMAAIAFFILVPRLALLANGSDAQRIWDTNTPAALRLLQGAQAGRMAEFFSTPQKYPLLGSLAYLPVVGAYYGIGRTAGAFVSPADFVNKFALGETYLYGWIRALMLAVNLFSLWLLYRLTTRFSASLGERGAKIAGAAAALLAAADFYVTMFSVAPRIHSWAFFGNIVALYGSLLLLEKKNWKTVLAGFGGAAVFASLAQSGFPALILPLLASLYDGEKRHWALRAGAKRCLAGVAFFIGATILLGYPQILAAVFVRLPLREVFLSGEHSAPGVSIRHLAQAAVHFVFSSHPLIVWLASAAAWFAWFCHRRERITGDAMDSLAVAHIAAFLLLFGWTNVLAGRFALAVLPSAFFLLARFAARAQQREKRAVIVVALIFFALQGAAIMFLARAAFGGDTRAQAVKHILFRTSASDRVLATVDPQLLGIAPAPSSVRSGESGAPGAVEQVILARQLAGAKTRPIALWDPAKDKDRDFSPYRFIVVSTDHPRRYLAEEALNAAGWKIAARFSAVSDPRGKVSIPWDMISPAPKTPLALHLWKFRAFGPTIEVYER